jgi:hypothetical protein
MSDGLLYVELWRVLLTNNRLQVRVYDVLDGRPHCGGSTKEKVNKGQSGNSNGKRVFNLRMGVLG